MHEVYPTDWPMAVDSTDPRNQFHRIALHEARFATDRREADLPGEPAQSFVARLRIALAGGSAASAQVCTDCPA